VYVCPGHRKHYKKYWEEPMAYFFFWYDMESIGNEKLGGEAHR
jgi:hypothetical protein